MSKLIYCACGCGSRITPKGKNGKPRKYIAGHQTNGKHYPRDAATRWAHRVAPFVVDSMAYKVMLQWHV